MNLIGVIISAVVAFFKAIFGMDKPATTETKHEDSQVPPLHDPDELLRDCGVHGPDTGSAGKNGPDRGVSGPSVSGDGKR